MLNVILVFTSRLTVYLHAVFKSITLFPQYLMPQLQACRRWKKCGTVKRKTSAYSRKSSATRIQ